MFLLSMINECLDADTPKYNTLCIHVTHRFNVHSFSCVSISMQTFDIFVLLRNEDAFPNSDTFTLSCNQNVDRSSQFGGQ
jgi:hypothetical protein